MGGACCKPPPEWNPDGTQKPIQTADEEKNDGRDLRKAAKELDLESMDKLVKRMPRDQIGSKASSKEVSPEEGGYTALHYVTAANFLKGAKKLVLYGHALNTGNDEGRTPLHVAIEAGKRKVTGFLLSKGADINAKDKQGETPLMTAMLAGDKGLTLWLLGWTPESTFVAAGAARPGQQEASLSPDLGTSGTPAAKPVTKGSLDIDFSVLSKKGLGLCVIAARQGWWDILQELVGWLPEDPSDPKLASTVLNTRSSDGETALGWVLKYAAGNAIRADLASSLVSLLLGRGASATVPAFKESVPPAALAAASGYTELYQQVLEAAGGEGAVQGIKDGLGRTLMHYAAAKGQLELVQQLLAKGLSAVTPDANKDTPLHLAALRGHAMTAKELLAATISNLAGMPAGPDQVTLAMALTMPNSSGKSVLHLAVCASMLPKAQQAALAVVNAVAESDPSKLNVETADLIKDTPLLLAARHHQHAVVKALLAAGCPVNQTNAVGETALTCCLASVTRDTVALDAAILRLLLEAGADAEPAPPPLPPPGAPKGPPLKKAPLPMQAICTNDCNEFAELALKELGPWLPGGKPDWTKADDMGRLPLHLAALYNNAYIVKHLLVDAKVDVDQPCQNGRTALMYAAMNGSVDSAILLLNRKAKVSLKDKEGQTALAYCLKLDKPETLQTAALLLRKGAAASNTALDVAGEGLLHRAVRYGASDFIRLWFRCGGKVNVVCSTPVKGAEVPTTLANYLASQVVLGPNEKAAKVQGETEAVEKVDLLDETEEAVLEFSPEDEEEEDSDHEEEQCRQNKEKRKAEGKPVGEGVEDDYWREDLSLAPQPSQLSFYTRPSRKQVSKWRKQGMGWWDTWLDDVKAQTDAHSCDDMDVALSQLLNPMHEDWVLEARDGPFSPDELLLEAIKQQENGCRAVAEGLMDDMTKQLTNKVTPLSGEEKPKISAAEAIQNCTVAEAIKQASELLKAEYQRHGLDMDDPYFLPDTLYQGQPKFMQIDLSPHSQQDIDNLVAAMHKRMDEYDELREPTLVGMPMRQRNLKWWLRSLCAEEYPMKVGAWRKLAKLTATALRVAAERVPSGVPLPQRKRTVFFGLPELPSRLELEETSALILAVRLGRVDCLQALLDCGDRTFLNKRDLWGHSALDYAYFMLAKDKRNMILQQMVDMLLYARPEVMAKKVSHTSCNHMDPLSLAVLCNDKERVAWIVVMCNAAIDKCNMFAPDIPIYLEGQFEPLVADTAGRFSPLHLAMVIKRYDMARLLLDLQASPNVHGWGYEKKSPYDRREDFLKAFAKERGEGGKGDVALATRDKWQADEEVAATAWVAKQTKAKKDQLQALALKGAEFAAKKMVASVASLPISRIIQDVIKIIKDFLGGPDPWVSPLHLASRYGQADIVLLLLDRGASTNGGKSARLCRYTPLEEALKFARSNFTYSNFSSSRHNWEAIIGEAFEFPAYSAKALAAAAKAGLMAMMDPATMTKKMFMLAMQAFKYLLDKLIESLRRPIAHYDPALRCVHVLVRAYAPIKPGESQGAVVVRDLQDNGTWVWASPHIMTKGDVTWLEKVNKMVADLKADKKIDYQKIGNTDTCKEHDKLVKRFKSKVELKYVTLGSEEFRREYKNKAAEAAQELKKRLAAKCLEVGKRKLIITKTCIATKALLLAQSKEFVIAVKTEKELAKEAHAKKGVKFTESALLKSKGGIKIAGFNLEDPANFLGGSYDKLINKEGSPGPQRSASRAALLTSSRSNGAGQKSGGVATISTRSGVHAGLGTPFSVPSTTVETSSGRNPLGCCAASLAAERARANADVVVKTVSPKLTDAEIKDLVAKAKAAKAAAAKKPVLTAAQKAVAQALSKPAGKKKPAAKSKPAAKKPAAKKPAAKKPAAGAGAKKLVTNLKKAGKKKEKEEEEEEEEKAEEEKGEAAEAGAEGGADEAGAEGEADEAGAEGGADEAGAEGGADEGADEEQAEEEAGEEQAEEGVEEEQAEEEEAEEQAEEEEEEEEEEEGDAGAAEEPEEEEEAEGDEGEGDDVDMDGEMAAAEGDVESPEDAEDAADALAEDADADLDGMMEEMENFMETMTEVMDMLGDVVD